MCVKQILHRSQKFLGFEIWVYKKILQTFQRNLCKSDVSALYKVSRRGRAVSTRSWSALVFVGFLI